MQVFILYLFSVCTWKTNVTGISFISLWRSTLFQALVLWTAFKGTKDDSSRLKFNLYCHTETMWQMLSRLSQTPTSAIDLSPRDIYSIL